MTSTPSPEAIDHIVHDLRERLGEEEAEPDRATGAEDTSTADPPAEDRPSEDTPTADAGSVPASPGSGRPGLAGAQGATAAEAPAPLEAADPGPGHARTGGSSGKVGALAAKVGQARGRDLRIPAAVAAVLAAAGAATIARRR